MSVHFRDLKGHKDLSVSLDQKGQTYVASMDLDFFSGFDQTEFTVIKLVSDIFLWMLTSGPSRKRWAAWTPRTEGRNGELVVYRAN